MGKISRFTLCLVIGGCGFMGRHLVEGLLAEGYQVRVYDIKYGNYDDRVEFFQGDLFDITLLHTALKGVDILFHTISLDFGQDIRSEIHRVNVRGTELLLNACLKMRINKFILTSNCAVISNLGSHIRDGREFQSYSEIPIDYAFHTKIQQEQLVLLANSAEMMTASVRVFGVFGPHPSRIISSDLRIDTNFKIGSGKNKSDFTYVDNAIYGHILTAQHLFPCSPVCGQAYNITNGQPVSFYGFFSKLSEGFEYSVPRKCLPYWLIMSVAIVLNILYSLLSVCHINININNSLTMSSVNLAGRDNYFSIEKSRVQLGFKPIYTLEEGLHRTIGQVRSRKLDKSS